MPSAATIFVFSPRVKMPALGCCTCIRMGPKLMWEQTDGRDWMLTCFFVHHTWDLFAECHPLNWWSQVDHITPADDEKIKPFTYHIHLWMVVRITDEFIHLKRSPSDFQVSTFQFPTIPVQLPRYSSFQWTSKKKPQWQPSQSFRPRPLKNADRRISPASNKALCKFSVFTACGWKTHIHTTQEIPPVFFRRVVTCMFKEHVYNV